MFHEEIQKEKDMKKYLNIDEVAEYINKKKATVYQMTHMRKIPFIKIGGNLLFDPDDIDAWLESQKIRVGKHR
jgi:excisionase family DNA binding protein